MGPGPQTGNSDTAVASLSQCTLCERPDPISCKAARTTAGCCGGHACLRSLLVESWTAELEEIVELGPWPIVLFVERLVIRLLCDATRLTCAGKRATAGAPNRAASAALRRCALPDPRTRLCRRLPTLHWTFDPLRGAPSGPCHRLRHPNVGKGLDDLHGQGAQALVSFTLRGADCAVKKCTTSSGPGLKLKAWPRA